MVPPCSDRISRVPPYSRIIARLRIRGCHPLWPDFPDRSASFAMTTGLFRVRSPLLAESQLMSVPPGTEMFQFPGFASPHYVFMRRYPLKGGLPHSDIHGSKPARGSPWLFAACHVLHRLLVPRHPPNALLTLEIAGRALRPRPPPWAGTIHQMDQPHAGTHSAHNTFTPLNAIAAIAGRPVSPRAKPVRHATAARPETHQNLIYTFQRTTAPNRIAPDGTDADPPPAQRRNTAIRIRGFPVTSNQRPQASILVETTGIEPVTPCLQSRCSPS